MLTVNADYTVDCQAFLYCQDGFLTVDVCDDGFYFNENRGNYHYNYNIINKNSNYNSNNSNDLNFI